MIKKLSIIACFVLGITTAQAQHIPTQFLDEYGSARITTEEFSSAHDTVVMINHRIDDVIWARYVYRIIDMRFKQNFQLYFPVLSDDPDYRNLFKVITDAVIDGMPIFEKGEGTIKPDFKRAPAERKVIPTLFLQGDPMADPDLDIATSPDMVVHYDSIEDEFSFNFYPFEPLVRNQLKYLTQDATAEEAETQWAEAIAQITHYAQDEKVRLLCGSTQLHLIVAQYRGYQLVKLEEITGQVFDLFFDEKRSKTCPVISSLYRNPMRASTTFTT